MSPAERARALTRPMRAALIGGAALLLLTVMGGFLVPSAFFHAYLLAFMLWLGVPLGAAMILMTHALTGGRWGWSIKGALEPAVLTLPLLALLFIPVLLGIPVLYRWALEAYVAEHELVAHKAVYLNVPFFVLRAVLFFGAWIVIGYLAVRWSHGPAEPSAHPPPRSPDEPPPPPASEETYAPAGRRLRVLSAIGLIVYIFTFSFAAIDWIASLEPEWFSSIFGLYLLVGHLLTTMAVIILVTVGAARWLWPHIELPLRVRHDLGNLLLMLVVLHAYLAFSQYFIIWNANLPHEVLWYESRLAGPWEAIAVLLILGHFFLPFAALLFRHVKRNVRTLLLVASWILLARVIEAFWLVLPSMGPVPVVTAQAPAMLLSIGTVLGIGGLWLGAFLWLTRRRGLAVVPGQREEGSHG